MRDGVAIFYADMLGLEPPYNFERAEKAYHKKVRAIHPDSNLSDNPEISDDYPEFEHLRKAKDFFKTYNP